MAGFYDTPAFREERTLRVSQDCFSTPSLERPTPPKKTAEHWLQEGLLSLESQGPARRQEKLDDERFFRVPSRAPTPARAPAPPPRNHDAMSSAESAKTSRPAVFKHFRVPKRQDWANEAASSQDQSAIGSKNKPTTMMIRNLPNSVSQKDLISELNSLGFEGTFDFLYIPIDTGTMGNVGYAFINFVNAAWAEHCQKLVDGYSIRNPHRRNSFKVASVSVAHLQGLEANLRHYENAAVNSRSKARHCGPVVMASVAPAASQLHGHLEAS